MSVLTEPTTRRSYDARMLSMADRLFRDFEGLPVRSVFRAVAAARAQLRTGAGNPVRPEAIEAVARATLDLEMFRRRWADDDMIDIETRNA